MSEVEGKLYILEQKTSVSADKSEDTFERHHWDTLNDVFLYLFCKKTDELLYCYFTAEHGVFFARLWM